MNNLENFSNWLQIFSFLILIEDFNNTDLMKYLEHQDNLLNKIIEQNEQIITLLKEGGTNGHWRNNTKNSW